MWQWGADIEKKTCIFKFYRLCVDLLLIETVVTAALICIILTLTVQLGVVTFNSAHNTANPQEDILVLPRIDLALV